MGQNQSQDQKGIELILLRQWAAHLQTPIWIAGTNGELLFYNEPAELLLGRRFDEAGEMPLDHLPILFDIKTEEGEPFDPTKLALGIALRERRPAHDRIRFTAMDGKPHLIEVSAVPIIAQGNRHLGAIVFFNEVTR
jgi:PAS domain-containing protein